MKFGVPWGSKGIRPEAREAAKEAARRAGMSLDDWLDSVIAKEAAQGGGAVSSNMTERKEPGEISHRVDPPAQKGPAAYAPPRIRNEQPAEPAAGPDRRPPMASPPAVPLPPALEKALAEISARQHTLSDKAAPAEPSTPPVEPPSDTAPKAMPPQVAPPRTVPPAQNLAGLEAQLRDITAQIETLRQPGVAEAIDALRIELGEIGQALHDAMPRHELEAIEAQIQGLARRVAEGRQAGADADALARIEHGLSEVREALRVLTPAENLVGYQEAVAGLAQKIDLIVAQKDPATLQQLQSAIITLREMVTRVASNETVSRLSSEVQRLAETIDRIAHTGVGGDGLSNLEHRIAALSDSLAERAQGGGELSPRLETLVQSLQEKTEQLQKYPAMMQQLQGAIATLRDMAAQAVSNETVSHLTGEVQKLTENIEYMRSAAPAGDALSNLEHRIAALSDSLTEHAQSGGMASPQIEALVQSLSEKVEQFHQMPTDNVAIAHLEDSIVALVEKLDATGSRFAQLDAIERGVSDLLAHVEELRATRAAGGPEAGPAVDALKQDIARTQDALEAVHGTLGHVVDRLAMIEQDIRERPRASAPENAELTPLTQPVGSLAVRLVSDAAPLVPAAAPASMAPPAAPARMPSAGRKPSDSALAPDQPLEPGSGQPRANAASRIAASEAALGAAKPAPVPPAGSRSNFIAAARRAAQAAAQEQGQRLPRGEAAATGTADEGSLRSRLMHRVKTLFVAASVIAIVIGSVQIASQYSILGNSHAPADKLAQSAPTAPDKPAIDLADHDNTAPAGAAAQTDAAPASQVTAPPSLPMTPQSATSAPTAGLLMPGTSASSLLTAPGALQPLDITGSVAQTNKPAPATPSAGGQLPVGIGGIRLRSAATAGDAAAAYVVGLRFAEGRGVPANLEEAAHWFELAAGKGLTPAQFRLASLLEKGQGVKKDLVRAQRLYLAAAGKGNAKAMHNLAVLYAEGTDGKPDYAAAAQWFRKAAERGVADSQFNLGVLAARGLGTDQSLSDSYKWFALAAKNGDREAAKKRDEVAGRLDAKDLAAAKHAVDSFVPERQPADAVDVPAPPGGWDGTTSAAPSKPKARPAGSVRLGKR